jgi:hypothetical protein
LYFQESRKFSSVTSAVLNSVLEIDGLNGGVVLHALVFQSCALRQGHALGDALLCDDFSEPQEFLPFSASQTLVAGRASPVKQGENHGERRDGERVDAEG